MDKKMADTQTVRAAKTRKFDSLEQEAYLSIWRTFDRLRSFDEALFAEWGLTAQQYNVLRLLQASQPEPMPTLSIAGKLVSRAPDITRMLDKLEESGLIERTRSATDRRAVLVSITPSGNVVLGEIVDKLKDCHEQQLGHLSATELRSLTQLLRKARMPHEPEDSAWR